MSFLNRSDSNPAVQAQKMAREWKFWIWKVEELSYLCSENKGADQLRSYCEADLYLCFRICKNVGFLMTLLKYGHINLPKYRSQEDANVSYMYRYIEQVQHPMYGSRCHH